MGVAWSPHTGQGEGCVLWATSCGRGLSGRRLPSRTKRRQPSAAYWAPSRKRQTCEPVKGAWGGVKTINWGVYRVGASGAWLNTNSGLSVQGLVQGDARGAAPQRHGQSGPRLNPGLVPSVTMPPQPKSSFSLDVCRQTFPKQQKGGGLRQSGPARRQATPAPISLPVRTRTRSVRHEVVTQCRSQMAAGRVDQQSNWWWGGRGGTK